MLKLNRTTEYGLIALTYIRSKPNGELTSAREVADHFDLPFEILAKTLQRLKDQGVISSTYGTRGGYVLSRDLATLDLAEFLKMMEGPVSVVACQTPGAVAEDCGYKGSCNIHKMMGTLNDRFYDFLHRISVEEITRSPLPPVRESVAFQGGEP
ncbi:MAG: Rrf2 family transcriptional regulator [Deltaproteobacteria bacterium]|nr:Rrf2 family transcriptional regulator [Deltaproteobacteria bacterium]